MSYLEDIYRLKHIIRYSNIPKVTHENVAEHSFFVCAIIMELHDEYYFNLGDTLAMAVAHDIPEMELNDCPAVIKRKYPAIQKAFDECEEEVAKTLPMSCQVALIEYQAKVSIESKMVRLADVIQCVQYASGEVKLGNEGYMKIVLDNSLTIIKRIEQEIKHAKRHREDDPIPTRAL